MIYSFKGSKSWTSDMLMKGLVLLIGNPKREITRLVLSDKRLPIAAIYVWDGKIHHSVVTFNKESMIVWVHETLAPDVNAVLEQWSNT